MLDCIKILEARSRVGESLMITHGILSSQESVTVLMDLIMNSKIESFDKGFENLV